LLAGLHPASEALPGSGPTPSPACPR
jgi:hypothetical protein